MTESGGPFDQAGAGVAEAAAAGDDAALEAALQPLRAAQTGNPEAVRVLLDIVNRNVLPFELAADVLAELAGSHPDDAGLLASIGGLLECARDIDDLNAPPPDHAVFETMVRRLKQLAFDPNEREREETLLSGLATAARMLARQHDATAERCYRRLAELAPAQSHHHYNLGLFFKTRGRFADGVRANREAISLSEDSVESYEWNLGICATGADRGDIALKVWKRMGQKIEMGRFGLPEGGYPQCKVRLAERPLAERDAASDDPGLEETIWIQRLSPCHGIVRSVLYQDLGTDYGDVVLFDGAPMTYHRYGDADIPVFPHLATLRRRGFRFFDFAGTQDEAGRLEEASRDLPGEAVVYSHTENFQMLCSACWRNPELDHEHDQVEEHQVVTGRIAVPPDVTPGELLDALDAALAERAPCRVYTPGLCEAAARPERVALERRRYAMLAGDAANA